MNWIIFSILCTCPKDPDRDRESDKDLDALISSPDLYPV